MTTFTNNVIPIEKADYTCIYAIDIDSVLKIDKKAFSQAYLEQCKYKYIDHLKIIDYDSDDNYSGDSENDNENEIKIKSKDENFSVFANYEKI